MYSNTNIGLLEIQLNILPCTNRYKQLTDGELKSRNIFVSFSHLNKYPSIDMPFRQNWKKIFILTIK